ncbi:hypothetical protein GCM10023205_47840 [Yinghuangia aomiensis]|uniref:Uncharacterized protein n=1 Tax=Yinghuangia aomiensis TaxID=676205 RepID=A0ABP9HPS1_9ACTN
MSGTTMLCISDAMMPANASTPTTPLLRTAGVELSTLFSRVFRGGCGPPRLFAAVRGLRAKRHVRDAHDVHHAHVMHYTYHVQYTHLM